MSAAVGIIAADAAAAFASTYGRQPDGVWSAPGRVNLIGEHTDYNDGFVLPFALSRRTAVAAARRDDTTVRIVSSMVPGGFVEIDIADIAPGAVTGWSAYALGMVWALGQPTKAGDGADLSGGFGLDLLVHSDVPLGAGLSSSAALECATGVALNELWQLGLSKRQIAAAGQLCENQVVGAPTGILDQSASMLCEADNALLLDCRSLASEQVPLNLADQDLRILVMDTRVEHKHADGEYADRRAACERGAAALGVAALRDLSEADLPAAQLLLDDVTYRRVRHVITENARVLATAQTLASDGAQAIGALLDASHASMRDDFEISCPELDTAVAAARAAGALGARMTGGGFGGSAIALIAAERVPAAIDAVTSAFAASGYANAPACFSTQICSGAGREL